MSQNNDSIGSRIDQVCEQFEQQLVDGLEPRIESFLADWSEPARSDLLTELIKIEVELLTKSGQAPDCDNYVARFPDQAQLVQDLLAERQGRLERVDEDLLFGLFALQLDFISREQLVGATNTWRKNKSRPLVDVLMELNYLTASDRDLLVPLIVRHVENHDHDARKSLASLSAITDVVDELKALGDVDVEATLSIVQNGDKSTKVSMSRVPGIGNISSGESRFRILRPHAKGGLGEVSVAEDIELRREVALKEIQPQFAHDQTSQARFVLEAEVTGSLEHPGIVPVYGLGHYDDGRPYYAMRFIHGDNLKTAIQLYHGKTNGGGSERILELRALLGRFVDICNAIEYSHSRGVLHRDLKPGNVMLGKYGETLVVDWGLAKMTNDDASDSNREMADNKLVDGASSTATEQGSIIGTPAYMSPEQASGRLEELGMTSDVYSLGATLYHLLTGQPAFTDDDVAKLLENVKSGGFPPPRQVRKDVPPVLEAICLKSMSLKPSDRYPTPRSLADDVEKWLADEPSPVYQEPWMTRIRRWGRKNPGRVGGILATTVVGVCFLITISAVLRWTNIELSNANDRITKEAEKTQIAQKETASVNQFLIEDILAQSHTDVHPYHEKITAIELLERAIAALEQDSALHEQPKVEATVRMTIARSQRSLGQFADALQQSEKALQIRNRELGNTHPDSLDALLLTSRLSIDLANYRKARQGYESFLLLASSSMAEDAPKVLSARSLLAFTLGQLGEYREAEKMAKAAMDATQSVLGRSTQYSIEARANYADILSFQAKDFALQKELYEANLAALTERGEDEHSRTTLTTRLRLAEVLKGQGQVEESEQLLASIVAARRDLTLPEHHHDTIEAQIALASFRTDTGKFRPAAVALRSAYQRAMDTLGPDHTTTWLARRTLGILLMKSADYTAVKLQQLKDSETLSRANFQTLKNRGWPRSHANTFHTETDLGNVFLARFAQGDSKAYPTAEETFSKLLAESTEFRGPYNLHTLTAQIHFAQLKAIRPQDLDDAIREVNSCLARCKDRLPDGFPIAAICHNSLGFIFYRQGILPDSEFHFRRYAEYCIETKVLPPLDVLTSCLMLAETMKRQNKRYDLLANERLKAATTYQVELTADQALPAARIKGLLGWYPVPLTRNTRPELYSKSRYIHYVHSSVQQSARIYGTSLSSPDSEIPFQLQLRECKITTREVTGDLSPKDELDPITNSGFHDLIDLEVKAGWNYRVSVDSKEINPFVAIEDSQGRTLVSDDNSGPGNNCIVEFVAATDGKYSIMVTSAGKKEEGKYKVRITTFEPDQVSSTVKGNISKKAPLELKR